MSDFHHSHWCRLIVRVLMQRGKAINVHIDAFGKGLLCLFTKPTPCESQSVKAQNKTSASLNLFYQVMSLILLKGWNCFKKGNISTLVSLLLRSFDYSKLQISSSSNNKKKPFRIDQE